MQASIKMGLCIFVFVSVAQAQTPSQLERISRGWIFELKNPPIAKGGARGAVRNDHQAFRQAARNAGVKFRERLAFENAFNGISVELDPSEVGKLSIAPNVKAVYPIHKYSLPPTQRVTPELATALAMTGADIVHSELGFTGRGIRVGIIDTGIDYNHPDLGGGFGPGFRVALGYDFVGDAYDGSNTPVPDPFPDDCNGHGTHVAGIVGANGAVIGVAPEVSFGAYRVFGCDGTAESDVIIAALERALRDGMDVVNMSLGASFLWPQTAEALAADVLVNRGIVVVASIGNDGTTGLYSAGAPGVGSGVIGVASFDNTNFNLNFFVVSPDGTKIGYNQADDSPIAPLSGTASMAATGTATSTADACSPLPAGSLNGKVALIRRGTCSFYQKAFDAQMAGAIGVAIYNNVAGRLSITVTGTPAITIPVVSISDTEGVLIANRLDAGPVTMSWTHQIVSFPNPTGGLISSSSSFGLSPDLTLKPDIGAPGGFIRSTFPLELGGYASLSGTSMASPHVAGAVALLLEARSGTSPQIVTTILQNSAEPRPWFGNPTVGVLDNVHRQGAGLLRIDRAILSTSTVTPGKLSLGESQAGPATRTITIQNNNKDQLTYALSHAPALATGPNTFTPTYLIAPATVAFSTNSVVVQQGGSVSVTVTISPNTALPDRSVYGGYLVVAANNGETYRVPYAGFKGDYQSIQVLAPTPAGFPLIARLVGTTLTLLPNGGSFTLTGSDVPYILVHLDHQSRVLRMEIFEANTGKPWHWLENDEYLPRNSSASSFFLFFWDGTAINARGQTVTTVPNGSYTIKLTIVKALGDIGNPADVETWTSPVITLARP